MIVKLKGFIEFGGDEYIDLDVNGVVFRVFISNKSIKKIYPSDSLISVFIYEIIKENERLFFGFLEYEEREIFSDLLCVQGVGGKMALNIMIEEIIFMKGYGLYVWSAFSFTLISFATLYALIKINLVKEQSKFTAKFDLLNDAEVKVAKAQSTNREILLSRISSKI